MLMTRRQAENWLDNSEGKQYNADGYYGFQCYDYSKMYFYVVTGEWIGGLKASNIPFDNKAKIEKYATIIKTTIVSYHKKAISFVFLINMVADMAIQQL